MCCDTCCVDTAGHDVSAYLEVAHLSIEMFYEGGISVGHVVVNRDGMSLSVQVAFHVEESVGVIAEVNIGGQACRHALQASVDQVHEFVQLLSCTYLIYLIGVYG